MRTTRMATQEVELLTQRSLLLSQPHLPLRIRPKQITTPAYPIKRILRQILSIQIILPTNRRRCALHDPSIHKNLQNLATRQPPQRRRPLRHQPHLQRMDAPPQTTKTRLQSIRQQNTRTIQNL